MTFYTPEAVAEMFDVSPATVYRWMRTGRLSHVRISARVTRISEAHVAGFVAAGERPAVQRKMRGRR